MLELMKQYPEATKVVKIWFMKKLVDSLNMSELPPDFKLFVEEQGVEDEKVAAIVKDNPRALFDVFDENEIFINISHMKGEWWRAINSDMYQSKHATRKEAESEAIVNAFKLLNDKLCPIELLPESQTNSSNEAQ
jgi:hypothetical protein